MKTYHLTLEALSPAHVGEARGEIRSLEFFQDHGTVCLVNEGRLARTLADQGLAANFVDFVKDNSSPSLDRYLEALGPTLANHLRKGVVLRAIPKAGAGRVNSLRPHLLDPASGTPYLPGSSLKGAIRGAFLLATVRKQKEKADRFKAKALERRLRNPGEPFEELLRASLKNEKGRLQNPNTDWLRFLHLSDAFPQDARCTEVREVKVVSLNNEGGYHWGANKVSLRVEAVRPSTRFTATLRLEDRGLALLREACGQEPAVDLEQVLTTCQAKFQEVLAADQDFFYEAELDQLAESLEALRKSGVNLRLGWGAGLLSTTLGLTLSPQERLALRDHYFRRRHPLFPQSRKVVVEDGQPVTTLGWFKMTLKEAQDK